VVENSTTETDISEAADSMEVAGSRDHLNCPCVSEARSTTTDLTGSKRVDNILAAANSKVVDILAALVDNTATEDKSHNMKHVASTDDSDQSCTTM